MRKNDELNKTSKPPTNLLVLNEVVIDRGPSPYLSNIDLFLDGKHITSVQGDGESAYSMYFAEESCILAYMNQKSAKILWHDTASKNPLFFNAMLSGLLPSDVPGSIFTGACFGCCGNVYQPFPSSGQLFWARCFGFQLSCHSIHLLSTMLLRNRRLNIYNGLKIPLSIVIYTSCIMIIQ